MKNVYLVLMFILLSAMGCSSQGKTSKVILDIGANASEISAPAGADFNTSGSNNLPSDILTVDLTVSNGQDGETLFEAAYSAEQAGSGISADIPSGAGRYFKVTARSSSASISETGGSIYYIYEGDASANLQPGIETIISISLLQKELLKSASIKLSILAPDGNPFVLNTNQAWMQNGLSADVFIPTAAGNIFDGTSIASASTVSGSIPNLSVYPKTFQVLFVKVYASDNGVSYIGGTTVGSLSEGENNVTVKLTNSSVIKLNLSTAVLASASTIIVSESIAETTVPLAALTPHSFTFIANTTQPGYLTALVGAYSGVSDYAGTYMGSRIIMVSVDGIPFQSTIYNTDSDALKWKSTSISPVMMPQ